MGFFTIEEDLPLVVILTFDFTLDIDEIFEVKAYPKSKKSIEKDCSCERLNKALQKL
jgi:hypothetical protein